MEDAINLVAWLCKRLVIESLDGAVRYEKEEEVRKAYIAELEDFIEDYSHYRALIGDLLQTFERIFDISLVYSIKIYLDQLGEVAKFLIAGHLDVDIVDEPVTEQTYLFYERIVAEVNASTVALRLSELRVDTSWLDFGQLKSVISLIINHLERDAEEENWDAEMAEQAFASLVVLHAVAKSAGLLDIFYYAANIYFDAICKSGMTQQARDLAEEMLITAFDDGLSFYGFFINCRVYSANGNIHAGLLYGNLFLKAIESRGNLPHAKFQFEMFWQSMKMMRDGKLYQFVVNIYEEIPLSPEWADYERRAVDLTYFSTLLKGNEPSLVFKLLEYLDRNRENLLTAGPAACARWLILLYNIQRLPQLLGSYGAGLDIYIKIFESIVPKESIGQVRDIIKGDNLARMKTHLKKALLKLLQTRQTSDFVYDNEQAVLIAHRLINISFAEADEEAVLLAMIVLSDYSLLVPNIENPELFHLDFGNVSVEDFYQAYPDPRQTTALINLDPSIAIICLLATEDRLYQFSIMAGKYVFLTLTHWEPKLFLNWVQSIVPVLVFDTGGKDKNDRNIDYFEEDYLSQTEEIKRQTAFPQLQLEEVCNEVLLVKEINLSALHIICLSPETRFWP